MAPRLRGIRERTLVYRRISSVHVNDRESFPWQDFDADATKTIFSLFIFPRETRFHSEDLGRLVVFYGPTPREAFGAPIESLINRFVAWTNFDEAFQTKALWFLAEDLMKQVREEATKEKLKSLVSYVKGVQLEYGNLLQQVNPLKGRTITIPVLGSWALCHTGDHVADVEVGYVVTREIT